MLPDAGLAGRTENTQIILACREHFSAEIAYFLVSAPLWIVGINPAQACRFGAYKNPHLKSVVIIGPHLGTTFGAYNGIFVYLGHKHLSPFSMQVIGQNRV